MNDHVDRLLYEAMQLTAEERSTVALALADSLDVESGDAVAAAWRVELDKRRADFVSGRVKPVSWEDAKKRLAAL
jgi:putative addiction module component (TIGR02574 family)